MKPRRGEDARLSKAARLAVLLSLDDDGLLEQYSDQQIADALDNDLNRSTVWRDKKLLAEVRRQRDELRLKLK